MNGIEISGLLTDWARQIYIGCLRKVSDDETDRRGPTQIGEMEREVDLYPVGQTLEREAERGRDSRA